MTPDWTPLTDELRYWGQAGLTLPLWWRDDDAVATTPQLEQLAALSAQLGIAVHLAVIPSLAEPGLRAVVAGDTALIPLVHGWAHVSHAPPDQKKAEFGAHRPVADMSAEAQAALSALTDMFGTRACPVFVPPWNRIDADLITELPQQGYRALSTFLPRRATNAAPGLVQINTHLDPIDWRGSRSLVAPDQLIATLVSHLRDRRHGDADPTEPYGILTHHLVHDAAIWSFTSELLSRLLDGPVTLWNAATAPELKGPANEPS